MANALFDSGREAFLDGNISWSTDSIKILLIDEGTDVPVPSTDDFLDDILAGARVATSGALTSKTVTAGVADCADETISAVSGATVESLVVFEDDAGAESADRLICYIDTGTGLPFTPNGGDVTIQIDSGASKLFKL